FGSPGCLGWLLLYVLLQSGGDAFQGGGDAVQGAGVVGWVVVAVAAVDEGAGGRPGVELPRVSFLRGHRRCPPAWWCRRARGAGGVVVMAAFRRWSGCVGGVFLLVRRLIVVASAE